MRRSGGGPFPLRCVAQHPCGTLCYHDDCWIANPVDRVGIGIPTRWAATQGAPAFVSAYEEHTDWVRSRLRRDWSWAGALLLCVRFRHLFAARCYRLTTSRCARMPSCSRRRLLTAPSSCGKNQPMLVCRRSTRQVSETATVSARWAWSRFTFSGQRASLAACAKLTATRSHFDPTDRPADRFGTPA